MSHNYNKFDAFFFDFDGLLVNTEKLHYESYKEMVSLSGFSLDWDFTTYLKYALQSTDVLKNAVYQAVSGLYEYESDWSKLRQLKQKIYSEKLEKGDVEFMAGADLFLQKLKEQKKLLCVVTNSPKNQVDIIKAHLPKLYVIDHWITRELYDKPKPDPDSYLKALDLLNPKHAIGFEDSPKGLKALAQTTIQPVFITPPYYPDFELDDFHDIWCYNTMSNVLKDFTTS